LDTKKGIAPAFSAGVFRRELPYPGASKVGQ
jgi:hypothetical protein